MRGTPAGDVAGRCCQNLAMTLYAVRYHYSDDSDGRDQHRPDHRAFLGGLADEGTLVGSGPLGEDGPPGALIIVRGEDQQRVLELLREDPFQQQGLVEQVEAREWSVVLGAWAADA
ncbi:hypothetical protein FB467_0207 [Ornithinicoccus hortensis]|uniref:YCII-related domain-containing protein n=2 Tax=Ornithinicoccus hortensis TaxID=82346 RepID=A0A542YM31_9MICO|nr:hypothetical protein FB467_0207 [Ornithinicoccus hortensis]